LNKTTKKKNKQYVIMTQTKFNNNIKLTTFMPLEAMCNYDIAMNI